MRAEGHAFSEKEPPVKGSDAVPALLQDIKDILYGIARAYGGYRHHEVTEHQND